MKEQYEIQAIAHIVTVFLPSLEFPDRAVWSKNWKERFYLNRNMARKKL